MVQRSELNINHKKFRPLYRNKKYEETERTIIKYLEASTWFTNERLGDRYKDDWKKRITMKNGGRERRIRHKT